MLKHLNRLPANIKLVYPKSINLQTVLIKIAPNSLSYSRFGFIIAKKVAKLAVDRNRSKRLLRSCIEDLFSQIKPGYDFLFIIRKNLAEQRKEILMEEAKVFMREYLAKSFEKKE